MANENTVRVHFIDGSEKIVPAKDIQYVGEEGARKATALVDGREVPIYKRSEPEWGPLWYEQEVSKDTFLWRALEEIDGFDGVLLPQNFYNFIVGRDGICRYTVDELEVWLNEKSEDDEEDEGDGSGLHQCPYCYNLVSEEHEEFCALSPYRKGASDE